MTVTLGEVAGLIAAVALCVLVGLAAVPLLKLGRTLDEVRLAVRDLGQHSVPVLHELRSTVENTNDEIAKLSLVTEDLAKVSGHATVVSENAASLSQLFVVTLGRPVVKAAALTHGVRAALKGRRK
ncbi:DUF948 domain-containing protein [Arachnia propionica]|uniref:DUF948 domain-containing protein n=1 Tax=Arachnia propionica TaxID=1750 RepID=UPI0021AD84B5|nr:DUF948 domain-containing protein [Arachnia propionica]